jgi:hypothetical protein
VPEIAPMFKKILPINALITENTYGDKEIKNSFLTYFIQIKTLEKNKFEAVVMIKFSTPIGST